MDKLQANVLKCLLFNKTIMYDFINESSEKLFQDPELFTFAKASIEYFKVYKQLPTLATLSERINPKNTNPQAQELFEKCYAHIESLPDSTNEYRFNLEKLKSKYAIKQLDFVKDSFNSLNNDEIDLIKAKSILNQSLKSLEVSKDKSFSKATAKDYIDTFKQEYNAKKKDKNFDKSVRTGYSYIDQVTRGIETI